MSETLTIRAYTADGKLGYVPVDPACIVAFRPVAYDVYSQYNVSAPDPNAESRPRTEVKTPADRGVFLLDTQPQSVIFIQYSPIDLLEINKDYPENKRLAALLTDLGIVRAGKADWVNYLTAEEVKKFVFAPVFDQDPTPRAKRAGFRIVGTEEPDPYAVERAEIEALRRGIGISEEPPSPGGRKPGDDKGPKGGEEPLRPDDTLKPKGDGGPK